MLIGNGLIARAFVDEFSHRSDVIIFASGSNSQERDPQAFKREELLLQNAKLHGGLLVYFSTCSIYDKSVEHSPYVIHKLHMEALVSESEHYLIFRLPQIVGKTSNPYALTNFIYNNMLSGEHFNVFLNGSRNILDVSDAALIVSAILNNPSMRNQIIDLANPKTVTILSVVRIFESLLGIKANFTGVTEGSQYSINSKLTQSIGQSLGIDFDSQYVEKVIQKYYCQDRLG